MQRHERCQGGERVVRGDVRQLTGIHRRQPDVELAHVADLPAQLGNPQQAVGIERRAPGQTGMQRGRQPAGVRRVDVEPDRGALEREAIACRVARRFRGADPWRAQPGQVEGQLAERVVVRRVLRIAPRHGRIGKRPGGPRGTQCRGGVGPAQRHAGAAQQRRGDCIGPRHRLLSAQRNWKQNEAEKSSEPHDAPETIRPNLTAALHARGKFDRDARALRQR